MAITQKWRHEFDDVLDIFRSISKEIREVADGGRFPPALASTLSRISDLLSKGRDATSQLRDAICDDPIEKLMMGRRLARHEFYLLVAEGVFNVPSFSEGLNAFDEQDLLYYEDEERMGYINPKEFPYPPPVRNPDGSETQSIHLRIGITPEDVKEKHLTDKQKDFFRGHHPELYSRFSRDT